MTNKLHEDPSVQRYAIIVGIVVQIFLAGIAWGTLWTKVSDIEKRLDYYGIGYSTSRRGSIIGPANAYADTIGEKLDRHTRN